MEIIYYASDDTMGDTPAAECAKYRAWAEEQLKAEFPGHEVSVVEEQSLSNSWTDDCDNEEEISDFCHRLWDRCPWDWN